MAGRNTAERSTSFAPHRIKQGVFVFFLVIVIVFVLVIVFVIVFV